MKIHIRLFSIVAVAAVLFSACNSTDNKETTTTTQTEQSTATTMPQPMAATGANMPALGDQVPNDYVCMVNDAYMGRLQFEVPFEGKTYYGCCDMCKERIPKDESVRYAIDPFSKNKVDKAEAYIVLIGKNGEVVYFENEENYKKLIES
ncbi:hypothetical protein [Albibacterium indicum]|uniref:hypothetical protein n=1 Tax=Albibacterium indicum TaxID=2292082 RepID=UPI000E46ADF4|nr:hypothetical protein [Pedobacter indicus]